MFINKYNKFKLIYIYIPEAQEWRAKKVYRAGEVGRRQTPNTCNDMQCNAIKLKYKLQQIKES